MNKKISHPNRMHIIHSAGMRSLNPNLPHDTPGFKKSALGKKAKSMGYKTTRFMKEVLENPDLYDTTTRVQANFMKNLLSFHK